MKKIIIYFPYEITEPKSGSMVRPRKMLEGFKEYCELNKFELIAIHGESKSRKQKVKTLIETVNPDDILFAYMENSTLPYWLTDRDHLPRNPFVELKFFKHLKKHNIPVGLFYRDIYWKFDEYPLTGLKRFIMKSIYQLEMKVYNKYISHFYLPSKFMNEYTGFPEERVSSLPPAGNKNQCQTTDNTSLNLIYVGGISERYGFKELILSAENVVHKGHNLTLHVVCREAEYSIWTEFMEQYRDKEWLKIYHASGSELSAIYEKSNVGIIPIQKNIYNDFAVPVKLFEYMSYGKPMIATNCNAQSEIVKENNIGIVIEPSTQGLEEGIQYFLDNQKRAQYQLNVQQALNEKHCWLHRAEQVANDLTKESV